jgi:hypothetical protein
MRAIGTVSTDKQTIVLASGHAKPLRTLAPAMILALFVLALTWGGYHFWHHGDWSSYRDIVYLWLLPSILASFFFLLIVSGVLGILLSLPRLSLENGSLVHRGIFQTKKYDLAKLGTAHAIQSSTLYNTMTLLAFFSVEEEASMARSIEARRLPFPLP